MYQDTDHLQKLRHLIKPLCDTLRTLYLKKGKDTRCVLCTVLLPCLCCRCTHNRLNLYALSLHRKVTFKDVFNELQNGNDTIMVAHLRKNLRHSAKQPNAPSNHFNKLKQLVLATQQSSVRRTSVPQWRWTSLSHITYEDMRQWCMDNDNVTRWKPFISTLRMAFVKVRVMTMLLGFHAVCRAQRL